MADTLSDVRELFKRKGYRILNKVGSVNLIALRGAPKQNTLFKDALQVMFLESPGKWMLWIIPCALQPRSNAKGKRIAKGQHEYVIRVTSDPRKEKHITMPDISLEYNQKGIEEMVGTLKVITPTEILDGSKLSRDQQRRKLAEGNILIESTENFSELIRMMEAAGTYQIILTVMDEKEMKPAFQLTWKSTLAIIGGGILGTFAFWLMSRKKSKSKQKRP